MLSCLWYIIALRNGVGALLFIGKVLGMNLTEFTRLVSAQQRADQLGQTGRVVWLTGLSGSGKSTVAFLAEQMLIERRVFATVLDGDSVRMGLCEGLGFSPEGRFENLRRIGHVARLMAESGLIVFCAFISPSRQAREHVRQIVSPVLFDLVYVNTPLDVCEARDPKGLYAKARRGEIEHFTGISAPYEAPAEAEIELDGSRPPHEIAQVLIEELSLA